MTRPLALLRPEPGWSASAAAVRAAGLEVVGHPLFACEPVDWAPPEGDHDALLVGSAAVFSAGGLQLAALRALPVHAVGESTARAARAAGFEVGRVGAGGLQQLLDAVAGEPIRYLRLTGEERVDLAPHPRQAITECVTYRMVPLPLSPSFRAELASRSPLVALHSAAAARWFAQLVHDAGVQRENLPLLALGPRIAEAAGPGWAACHVADTPTEAALLVKAAALCKGKCG